MFLIFLCQLLVQIYKGFLDSLFSLPFKLFLLLYFYSISLLLGEELFSFVEIGQNHSQLEIVRLLVELAFVILLDELNDLSKARLILPH